MSYKDLISIIIPIFNAEDHLRKALESVQSQSYRAIEVIMIDDGSTDSSADICREFAEKDNRFIYFYQENAGVSAARNAGLRVVKGKYIAFLDSDDWVEPNCVEVLYNLLVTSDADISIVSFYINLKEQQEDVFLFSAEQACIELYINDRLSGYITGKLYKSELFFDVNFSEDIAILEDMVAVAKLINNAQKVAFKNTPLYHYEFNPTSATKVKWNPKTWTCLRAAEELYNIVANNYPEEIIWGKLRACTTVMVIPKKLSGCGKLTKKDYELLKAELLKYYAPEINEIANKRERAEFRFFFKGRIPYIVYRKIVKNKLAIGLRNCLVKRGLM